MKGEGSTKKMNYEVMKLEGGGESTGACGVFGGKLIDI